MLSRAHAGVAGKRGGQLHDRAGVVRMVVVAGQQRRAGRAAQRRGVKAVVLQPAGRQLLQRRHVDRPAEGAAVAEADVVDQHDHDVRRALRRLHLEARRRLRVARVERGDRLGLRLRDRQHGAVEFCVSSLRQGMGGEGECASERDGYEFCLYGYLSWLVRLLADLPGLAHRWLSLKKSSRLPYSCPRFLKAASIALSTCLRTLDVEARGAIAPAYHQIRRGPQAPYQPRAASRFISAAM